MTRAIVLQLSCHKITDAIMAMLHFETTDTTSDLTHFQQIQTIKVILTVEPVLREKHSKLWLQQTKNAGAPAKLRPPVLSTNPTARSLHSGKQCVVLGALCAQLLENTILQNLCHVDALFAILDVEAIVRQHPQHNKSA